MQRSHSHIPFSEELSLLAGRCANERVTFERLESELRERGAAAMMIFLCLPFLFPMPLPGVSTVFGAVIALLGIDVVRMRPPRLPKFIAKKSFEGKKLVEIVNSSCVFLRKLEKLVKPRMLIVVHGKMRMLAGLSILSSAVALSLPIPPVILFSNSMPAIAIICLSIGFLERDGFFVVLGHFVAAATWGYFYIWSEVIWLGIELILKKLS